MIVSEKHTGLYRRGRREVRLPSGHFIAYGYDHVCGSFVQVWDERDDDKYLVDVDELFDGATAVLQAYDKWVLG